MNLFIESSLSLCRQVLNRLWTRLESARPARSRARLQVEALEGRIALSSAGLVKPPRPTGARVAPEKNTFLVHVPIEVPPGYGWFLEVRRKTVKGHWQWKGPFSEPASARSKLRRQGFVVRSNFLRLPEEPPPPADPGPPADVFPPDPGLTLETLKNNLLQLEVRIPWSAVYDTWVTRRPSWITDVRNAWDANRVGGLLIELETATKWEAVYDWWVSRRPGWLDDVRSASTTDRVEQLRAEFASSLRV